MVLSLILLVASVILNVALAEKLRGANNKLSKVETEANIAIGATLPDMEAKNLDGTFAIFSFSKSQRPTIVYIFSPSCGWCEKNLENIKELVEQTNKEYQFVALSTSNKNLAEYVAENNWKFPVFRDPSPATISAYKLGGTPRTIVISEEGKVVKNWSGAYMANLQKDIEEYFQVKLPGIRQ